MFKACKKIITLGFIAALPVVAFTQSLSINTDGSLANASALLDVKSISKGVLIPRMTAAQRVTIVSPTESLLVYQTDATVGFYFYKAGIWTMLSDAGSVWALTGNAGTVDVNNFIGTTDNIPLSVKVNNQQAGRIDHIKNNSFWGYRAGLSNTTGYQNTAVGTGAFQFNTDGFDNTAIGAGSLQALTFGLGNTAVGSGSMQSLTGAGNNTALGYNTLRYSTSSINNTALGAYALFNNTTGQDNSATGFNALVNNTTGIQNTASGYGSLNINSTGEGNTGIGVFALGTTSTGSFNTAVGVQALQYNTTGTHNTAIGWLSYVSAPDLTNTTAIGNQALVNASNKIRLGSATVTAIEGQVAYSFPSDGRFKTNISETDVKGLEFIMLLRPVVYNFDTKKFDEFLTKDMPGNIRATYTANNYGPSTAIRQSGFIAQEVEKAAEQSGYNFNGIHKPDSNNDHYSLAYSQFVVPLIKGMQEQQQMIKTQQLINAEQQNKIAKLQLQIETLTKLLEQLAKEKSNL
jgi:trimeric autotransporter adhesin